MKLSINAQTIHRRYYRDLQALIKQAQSECAKYEAGQAMTTLNVTSAAVTAIESGTRAELINDFLVEE